MGNSCQPHRRKKRRENLVRSVTLPCSGLPFCMLLNVKFPRRCDSRSVSRVIKGRIGSISVFKTMLMTGRTLLSPVTKLSRIRNWKQKELCLRCNSSSMSPGQVLVLQRSSPPSPNSQSTCPSSLPLPANFVPLVSADFAERPLVRFSVSVVPLVVSLSLLSLLPFPSKRHFSFLRRDWWALQHVQRGNGPNLSNGARWAK